MFGSSAGDSVWDTFERFSLVSEIVILSFAATFTCDVGLTYGGVLLVLSVLVVFWHGRLNTEQTPPIHLTSFSE